MNYPKLAKYKEGGPMSEDCYEDGGIGDFFKNIKNNVKENRKRRKGRKPTRCSKARYSKYTRTKSR
tara:strand:+ start:164 stop:361 length:198 start_codon:yes stop_codon:yes gene_type:complete